LAHSGLRFGLTRREAWAFVALVIALVGFGVAPRPLVDSRFAASDEILRLRQVRLLGRQTQSSLALDRAAILSRVTEARNRERFEAKAGLKH
jgi:hypothetical protein